MVRIIKAFEGGQRSEDITAEMCDRIKEVVYDYAGKTTLASAPGVLEIAKHEILRDAE